ncbi:MAG: ABC transporter permease [Chloroflexi bacterium]|jgi:simple sugar transport system permease protein|nr:ABC transporter permease [Chloroflexota bacterium]
MKIKSISKSIGSYLFENKVMIAFAAVCLAAIILSGSPLSFIVDGVITRVGRNTFTVLALIIPVIAGLGLNFGMVIGAVAAQIALFWVVHWGYSGFGGMMLCVLLATPIAAFFGYLVGSLFNRMKGTEMIAGLILGYFADGLYQLLFLVIIGGVIPVNNPTLIISHGVGVKNTIDLSDNLKYSIDAIRMLDILTIAFYVVLAITVVKLILHLLKKYTLKRGDLIQFVIIAVLFAISYIPVVETFLFADRLVLLNAVTVGLIAVGVYQLYIIVQKKFIKKEPAFSIVKPLITIALCAGIYAATYIPELEAVLLTVKMSVLPFLLIAALCLFNQKILDTRLGQNMRTVGQSQSVALASGINVDQTRVIAMIISTVLASWGQLIYLQNIGTFATYGAHLQIAQFAIAALLVGGASVQKATNKQAIIGVILFHTLFIVAPQAGKNLFDNAQIGEYFRVFVSYGVIALSLAMHAWKIAEKKTGEPPQESSSLEVGRETSKEMNAS